MDAVNHRLRGVSTALTRIAGGPLLVRAGITASLLAAFGLAYPVSVLTSRLAAPLLLVAVLPAVFPRRFWPTLAVLVAVTGWVADTGGSDQRIGLARLLSLAALLYLTHHLCALAAFLPYDAVLAPGVLTGWLLRALGVLLASGVLGVLLIAVSGRGGDGTFVAAALGGLVVAVLTAALLAWSFRRR
ncbi:MAG TPA: hypothetical protein VGD43_19430 [Micromonospora sp.]